MATINITGTGGIIEGNLGAANVNVNLDAVHTFDGTDDYLSATSAKGDVQWNTTSFSATAWVYMTDNSNNIIMACSPSGTNTGWGIMIDEDDASGLFSLSLSFTGLASASTGKRVCGVTAANALHTNQWHHIAVTFNGADYTAIGNYNFYIDGVLFTTGKVIASDYTSRIDGMTANKMWIGKDAYNEFTGNLADCRVYDDILTATEIAAIASKINYESSSAGNLIGRWKIAGTSIDLTDSSANSNNATASGSPATVYDKFSVDVYDNSTTTDGTFTVTQGKVEGKALSHLTFDGSNDFAVTSDDTVIIDDVDSTIAFWYKGASPGTGTIAESRATSNDAVIYTRLGTELRYYTSGSGEFGLDASEVTACGLYDDEWHHVAFVLDHGGALADQRVYVDGVSRTLTAISTVSSLDVTWRGFKVGGQLGHINAELRDIKVFDYSLSAEQTSSLYSNTYPQTPKHNWKFDEGTGTSVEDSGTATDQDLTINGATYVNGTLDLDGNITIQTNGVLSAPRGTFEMEGASANFTFRNLSTVSVGNNASGVAITGFIHNNGTVDVDGSVTSNPLIMDDNSVANTTFYNLTITNNHQIRTQASITVENNYTLGSSTYGHIFDPDTLGSKLTFTMGTPTEGGIMALSDGKLRGANDSQVLAVVGASDTDYTQVNTNPFEFDFDDNGTWELKNLNFNTDITTSGASLTLRLMGDCEFNAVTVSSGDTLDLNGQRAEFSGTLNIDGTLDADGLIVSSGSIDEDGGFSNADSCDMILTGAVSHDFRGATHRNILINTGTGTSTNNATKDLGTTPFTIGSGTFSNGSSGRNLTCGNFTIATGGTYTADDATVTVAGDFTTSGGLIGKSALVTSGDNNFEGMRAGPSTSNAGGSWQGTPDSSDWNFTGAAGITIEGWIKPDDLDFGTGNDATLFGQIRSGGTGDSYGVGIQINDDTIMMVAGSNDTTWRTLGNGAVTASDYLTAGKWTHLAMTVDANNSSTPTGKLYIDGKLVTQHTGSSAVYYNYQFIVGGPAYSTDAGDFGNKRFDGTIARVSAWNIELTQAQIRAMMFEDYDAAVASSTPHGNARLWYEFDEGTGLIVDNKGAAGSDHDGTLSATGTTWAGAGDFNGTVDMSSGSTSTNYNNSTKLIMNGAGKSLNYISGEILPHLNIANTSGTITANVISGTNNLTVASLTTEGGSSEFTAPAGTLTITAENTDGMAFELGAFNSADPSTYKHNNGTVTFNNHSAPAVHAVIICGQSTSTDGLYNVIIDGANTIVSTYQGTNGTYIYNNYTHTNGNLKANGASNTFTVLGNVSLNGGNMFNSGNAPTGAHTYGSLTITAGTYKATSGTTTITNKNSSNYIIQIAGLFTHNSGTVKIDTSVTGDKLLDLIPSSGVGLNHLIVNEDGSGSVQYNGNSTIAGDLTIEEGRMMGYDFNNSELTVNGNVSIEDGGTLGVTGQRGDCQFGSLTIASGGTHVATSGTTTITNEASGYVLSNSGTFTHNKGTVKITCPTQTSLVGCSGTNGLYNLTYAGTGTNEDLVLAANTDFFGHVIIDSANSEIQSQGHTFNYYNGITIKQGGWDIGSSDESGTVNVYGAVRNVGGSITA